MSFSLLNRWLRKAERTIKLVEPERRELDFKILLAAELSDENIERLFLNFFLELCQFVHDGFGKELETTSEGHRSPWNANYHAEFYQLVLQLARPGEDIGPCQWDSVLRERPERCVLLQGVILKIFEENVFSSLLFGATAEHTQLLALGDSSLINCEGFRRTRLRADTNRIYLGPSDGMPRLFWREVDKVATQMMHLLLPVYAHVGEYTDSAEGTCSSGQGTAATYQALHDLVAHAAWLSIAFRLCPQIAVWEWVRPGEPYKFEYVSVGDGTQQDGGSSDHGEDRRQRVMICAAPRITLHSSGSEGPLEGRIKYTVMEPRVVCYLGHRLECEDDKGIVPLQRYAGDARMTLGNFLVLLLWFSARAYLGVLMFGLVKSYLAWKLGMRRSAVWGLMEHGSIWTRW